jgi:alpha/beta superfamily hydrolase
VSLAPLTVDGLEVVQREPVGSGRGYAVIAAPHPLYGGSLDNPVVEALAQGFAAGGLGAVAFNYRGVGRSEGQASADVARAADDYGRIIGWLRSTPAGQAAPLCLAGYSFGAVTAIACAIAQHAAGTLEPASLALVAPPLGMLGTLDLAAVAAPSFVLMGQNDDYLPLDAARAYFASIAQCTVTESEADHFFAYEIDEVSAFARRVAKQRTANRQL